MGIIYCVYLGYPMNCSVLFVSCARGVFFICCLLLMRFHKKGGNGYLSITFFTLFLELGSHGAKLGLLPREVITY